MQLPNEIQVIDSHTGGEPTRIVISGGPEGLDGPMDQRRATLKRDFDWLRRAVVDEPRGNDIWIGGLLVPPHRDDCVAGVVFFNTADYLGMCGHGTIGLIVTLADLGHIEPGEHGLDTPVGRVKFVWHGDHRVSITNVTSYRTRADVSIDVPAVGRVIGDVAWGGNWFFCIKQMEPDVELSLDQVPELTRITLAVRDTLWKQGITGRDGGYIDHIEIHGPARNPQNDSRNFVLTPSGAYDRSPCGTGSSAKMACLAADGQLTPGQVWRQESIVGSVFECSYEPADAGIHPTITGTAFVTARGTLVLNPDDPFRTGIRE